MKETALNMQSSRTRSCDGIPTRIATLGFLESFENRPNVMGFHMWTEFHLRGQWISFDAALKKLGNHADRITLSVSS